MSARPRGGRQLLARMSRRAGRGVCSPVAGGRPAVLLRPCPRAAGGRAQARGRGICGRPPVWRGETVSPVTRRGVHGVLPNAGAPIVSARRTSSAAPARMASRLRRRSFARRAGGSPGFLGRRLASYRPNARRTSVGIHSREMTAMTAGPAIAHGAAPPLPGMALQIGALHPRRASSAAHARDGREADPI